MYYLDNIRYSRFCLAWAAKFLDTVIKLSTFHFFFKASIGGKKNVFHFISKIF